MAGNGSNQPLSVPQFKGEKYHLWSLKMKTMFRSQEVWDLVENGFEDANPAAPDQQLRESRKKDAKALFLIQSALDEDILSRIVAVNTSHEAWEILKREYLGDQKVITVKLQTLRHSFETISMKEKETIQEYLARVSTIVKGEFSAQNNSGYGRGRGSFRGGRGRGRSGGRGDSGRGTGQSDSVSLSYNRGTDKSNIQCHYCKKYGHMQVDCWKKQNEEKQASFVEEDVQPRLFMAYKSLDVSKTVWYLDSGCSNHMSGIKSMFKEIDESYKLKVKLGDDKEVQVEGRGIVVVHNGDGNLKLIYDVYYIPELAQNLLSVGQMVENNCSVFFDGNVCVIKDKKSGSTLAVVKKTSNNLYPLEMSSVEASSLVAKVSEETRLWHLRNVTFDEVSVWRWREGDNGELVEVLSDSTAEQEENQSPAGSEVNTPANSVPNSPNSSNDGGANSEGSTPQKFRSLRDIYEMGLVMRFDLYLMFVMLMGLGFTISNGYKFYVGGKDGWVPTPILPKIILIGLTETGFKSTTLFYGKGKDSVLEVREQEYNTCNTTTPPLTSLPDGDSLFLLSHSGSFFFISGNSQNCLLEILETLERRKFQAVQQQKVDTSKLLEHFNTSNKPSAEESTIVA
ncbi:unnamed protein product [Arabidopsis arenosa]|uniref:Phytocyanin domain-containing protein n=1 Tax=Arabidopsis arenosa TaxID=38785 RepID=A0A8S1ZXS3_ARAAE|nr:unnamed protein product [Arabidopsis arenosa]